MILEPFAPFVASDFQIKFATANWERHGAAALRRQVFCREQGLFAEDDADETDAVAIPIVAVSLLGIAAADVVGTVRIHQPEPGLWWGSRLAVAASHRRIGTLGPSLIKLAVSSAAARGCVCFHAQVQSQNELLFRRMHWRNLSQMDLHGMPHLLMQADLSHYPPIADGQTGFHAQARRAA